MTQTYKGGSILVVDDNSLFSGMLTTMLTDLGYASVPCNDPSKALRLFSSNPDRFDMAIVDEIMPDMKGTELAVELLKVKHDLPVVLLTGYGSAISLEQVRTVGFRSVLLKPLLKGDLRILLDSVLGGKVK